MLGGLRGAGGGEGEVGAGHLETERGGTGDPRSWISNGAEAARLDFWVPTEREGQPGKLLPKLTVSSSSLRV